MGSASYPFLNHHPPLSLSNALISLSCYSAFVNSRHLLWQDFLLPERSFTSLSFSIRPHIDLFLSTTPGLVSLNVAVSVCSLTSLTSLIASVRWLGSSVWLPWRTIVQGPSVKVSVSSQSGNYKHYPASPLLSSDLISSSSSPFVLAFH